MTIQQHASFDSSAAELNATSKLVKAWESKNAKNAAKAGGVSLMALSLAACGGSSTPVADAPVAADPVVDTPVVETPAGQAFALTDQAVTAKFDGLVGTAGNDTYSGDKDTIEAGDIIIDQGGDADVANFSGTGDMPGITVSGVESVNVTIANIAAAAAQDVDATNLSGVETLTITKADVVVGGSTLAGNKAITVVNVNADNVAKVVAGVGTTVLNLTQATKAGATIDADNASGNVNIDGVGTITAMGQGTGDTLDVDAIGVAAEDAKALDVTTSAAVVNVEALTGTINVNATAAADVILAGATGGATVVALGDKGTAGTDGIKITGVDASGVSVTTSYVGSATGGAEGEIQLLGTAKATDVATVSAAGVTNLDLDTAAIETVNLSGNGQAVTFNIVDLAATTYAGSGDHAVNLAGNVSKFNGKTITGIADLDLNAGTAADIDLSAVATTTNIDLGYNNLGDKGGTEMIFTVASGATFEVTVDQTDMIIDFGAAETSSNVNIIVGDVNGALNSAVGTLGLVDLDVNSAIAGTVSITANEANLTTNTIVVGAKQTLTLTGDEDFTTGVITAKSVDATGASGIVTATSTTSALTFSTGSGADVLTANGDAKHVFSTGAGNDDISIDDTKDASTFAAGAGNDTVRIDQAGGIESIVVTLGDGDDTMIIAQDSDAVIVAGDGSDTLDVNAAINFSDNTNSSFTGFEKFDLTGAGSGGTVTISAAQLAGNSTFAITADDDTLQVTVVAAAGGTLDASGVTVATGSTATLSYTGSTKADTITGGVADETINYTVGGDSIEGGATGTDTLSFATLGSTLDATALGVVGSDTSTGSVINASGATVTSTTIYAATSQYTGSDANVAAGTHTHLYAANKTTNSTEVTSFSGIENIVGGDGIDYIVGSSAANTIDGGAGADTILGGDGDDVITGGDGVDKLTGGNGSDTFVVKDTGSGNDVISDFTVGTGNDKVRMDLSGLKEDAAGNADVTLINIDLATSDVAAGDTVVLSTITGATDAATLTTDTTILVANLAGNIADAAALETALETGGNLALTLDGASAAKDAFMVAFDDGSHSYLAHVEFGAIVANNALAASGGLTATIVTTFTGIDDVTDLVAGNFTLIA